MFIFHFADPVHSSGQYGNYFERLVCQKPARLRQYCYSTSDVVVKEKDCFVLHFLSDINYTIISLNKYQNFGDKIHSYCNNYMTKFIKTNTCVS